MEKERIFNETEILQYISEAGILDIDDVQNQMTKKRRKEILKQHPYEIWQGKDSRFRTYIEDSTKKSGRRMIVKTYEENLLDYLAELYDS